MEDEVIKKEFIQSLTELSRTSNEEKGSFSIISMPNFMFIHMHEFVTMTDRYEGIGCPKNPIKG